MSARLSGPRAAALCTRAHASRPLRSRSSLRLRRKQYTHVFATREFACVPFESRNALMDAVERLGCSATCAEVAQEAGIDIASTERYLQQLAAETNGRLKVTSEGDVIYVLPTSFRVQLLTSSARLRSEKLVRSAGSVALASCKVLFGVCLFISIALATAFITFSVIAIASASSNDSESSSSRRGSWSGTWISFDLNELFNLAGVMGRRTQAQEARPGTAQRPQQRGKQGRLEAIFAYVFGSSDPNDGFEKECWRAIGQYISARAGVVAAEEILPLLGGHTLATTSKEDEGYMLPVLLRLNGEVLLVDGHMMYRFPDLQRTLAGERLSEEHKNGLLDADKRVGGAMRVSVSDANAAAGATLNQAGFLGQEGAAVYSAKQHWDVDDAVKNRSLLPQVKFFAALNIVLVGVAAALYRHPAVQLALAAGGPNVLVLAAAVRSSMLTYAAAYVVGPLLRMVWAYFQGMNISKENELRRQAAMAVAFNPTQVLQEKLAMATALGERFDLSKMPVAYDSETSAVSAVEAEIWDERFGRQAALGQKDHQQLG